MLLFWVLSISAKTIIAGLHMISLGTDETFFQNHFSSPDKLNPNKNIRVFGLGQRISLVSNIYSGQYKLNETIFSFLAYEKDRIKDVRFSPSGSKIIATSYQGIVRIWDIKGRLLHEIIDAEDPIHLATFGASDSEILTNSQKNINKIWLHTKGAKL